MILVLIFDRTDNNATNPNKTFITLLLKSKLVKQKPERVWFARCRTLFCARLRKKNNTSSRRNKSFLITVNKSLLPIHIAQ